VVVVSKATAEALWPGLDPLGQTLEITESSAQRRDRPLPHGRLQVIGVAEDVANGSMTDGIDASCVYFPIDAQGAEDMALLVRGRSDDPDALRKAVTTALDDVARETPIRLTSMQSMVVGIQTLFHGRVDSRHHRSPVRVLGDPRRRLIPRGTADT
jgi:hypothetical protein